MYKKGQEWNKLVNLILLLINTSCLIYSINTVLLHKYYENGRG